MLLFILLCFFFAPLPCPADGTNRLTQWDRTYRSGAVASPDYAKGLSKLQEGILFGVSDCDLYYRMGYCYQKLGRTNQAERAFRMALSSRANCPTDILYYTHFHVGMLNFERGNLNKAREHFRIAVEIKPERWVARNNIVLLERALGERGKLADELSAINRQNPILRHNRAILLGEEGRVEEAVAECDSVLPGSVVEPLSVYTSAELLNTAGRHREAEKMYLAYAFHAGDDPMPYFRLAEIALLEGRYNELIINLQRALDVFPHRGFPPAIAARIRAARALLMETAADTSFRGPTDVERERSAWLKVLSRNEEDARIHYELGRLYEFNESGERYGDGFPIGRALKHYEKALLLRPDHPHARLGHGNICYLVGDSDAALREYAAAVEAVPDLYPAHFNKGLVLFSKGRFEEALVSFGEALKYEPDLPQVHCQTALALSRLGQYDEALEEYEKALDLLPGDGDCYFNMAQIYANHLGEKEKAIKCYTLYLRSRPEALNRKEVLALIAALSDGNK